VAQQTPPNLSNSTQNSLLIAEIKDGIVIMRDGSLRAVILSSAINFDLMSQREQDGVEMAYQGFLNSLHFPIQILIKSQKIDLDNYIAKLQKLENEQDNPLLGELMEDYIANIKALVDQVNIMDKQFFVVVPYYPLLNVTKQNVASSLSSVFKPVGTITLEAGQFEQAKTELRQRVQLVASGLTQMGLRAIPLNSQELIDLYYSAYNPDVAQNQKLIDAAQLQTASVTKGEGRTEPPLAGGGL
jgi:type IV secretory pathway VirB4 component